MAHREVTDAERCGKSALLGVHVWEYETKQFDGEYRVENVWCHHCTLPAPADIRDRLASEYEVQLKRDRLAKALHKAQKDGTGVNLTRK